MLHRAVLTAEAMEVRAVVIMEEPLTPSSCYGQGSYYDLLLSNLTFPWKSSPSLDHVKRSFLKKTSHIPSLPIVY